MPIYGYVYVRAVPFPISAKKMLMIGFDLHVDLFHDTVATDLLLK